MKYGKYGKYGKHRKRGATRLNRMLVRFFGALIITVAVPTAVYLWCLHSVTASSDVNVCFQSGTLSITWDTSFNMDACRLFRYDEGTKKYISCGQYQNGMIMMDAVEAGKEMKLRLQAVRYAKLFGHRVALLGFSRKFTVNPREITEIELHASINPENKKVLINWREDKSSAYEVYLFDHYGKHQLYSEIDGNTITLDFANDFELPDRRAPVKVAVRAVRREKDYTLYSPMSENVVITRADLLENNLSLCWEQVEERQYVLSWQECSGDWYEVQQWSEDEKRWVSRRTFDWTQEMTYRTEHLPSNMQVRFRIITYDNVEDRDREEFKADPAEAAFHTGMSTLYCTIWPIVPLKIVDRPQGGEILGEVPAGQALCVLEENGNYFKILYKDYQGYIDSRYCMINLPEYMGDVCMYNITNSIHSIFRVHGYRIPEITDNVVKGYENVYLDNGSYLVPYLYPCTVKLYQAALNAAEDGYSFCIYDAFRPNEATRYLYDTVETVIDEAVIEESDEDESDEGRENEEIIQIPESEEAQEIMQTEGEQAEGEPLEEAYDTYRSVMTNGRYHLSSFLAASVSAHNRGIALDLTLVDAGTQEELLMQSDMHDLSWYSVIVKNNENARLLAKYMKGVGYHDLSSEWWHFQDDETRNEIGLNSYLTAGVSIEGWKRDDVGWKYRLKDGSYYKDKTVLIDGKEYIFDAEGYCTREEL